MITFIMRMNCILNDIAIHEIFISVILFAPFTVTKNSFKQVQPHLGLSISCSATFWQLLVFEQLFTFGAISQYFSTNSAITE